jgi:hypothetical protein
MITTARGRQLVVLFPTKRNLKEVQDTTRKIIFTSSPKIKRDFSYRKGGERCPGISGGIGQCPSCDTYTQHIYLVAGL